MNPRACRPRPVAAAAVILFALGLVCGLALLVKRAVDPALRGLSVPDDFLANLLASGALAMGLAAVVRPAWLPFFQVMGGMLLLYAPLGKLRHMLFLITSRVFWGEFYGRRGVRPAPRALAERNG